MRRRSLSYVAMMALCVMAAPALAASKADHADCNADNPDRSVKGCTRIINDAKEAARMQAIALVGRGLAWRAKRDLDKAMSDFTQAIRLDPQNSLAYNNRGLVFREKRDPDRAIADFSESIRLDALPRSDLPGPGRVNVYVNRGLAYEDKGDLDRAIEDFTQALAIDVRNAEAYYRRGQAHVWKQDFALGLADLNSAISLDRGRPEVYYLRGAVRYNSYMVTNDYVEAKDLRGAIEDFSDVLRLEPENMAALHARASAFNTNGERDRAIADLTGVVLINPFHVEAIAALKQLKPDYKEPANPVAEFLKTGTSAKATSARK